jgi:hypothetical protein
MTNQSYPPLRPQTPHRVQARQTPWATIIGLALLAILAGAAIAILMSGDDEDGVAASPGASGSGSPSASASTSESGSASPSASGSTSPAPSASSTPLGENTIVATTVDGLSVRREPGTGAERLGSLTLGSESFVVQGPTDAGGIPWYLVSNLGLPPNSGCAVPELETDPYNCPAWFGWVAGASEEGERWLEPVDLQCPSEPLTAEALILARTDLQRLACFGPTPFTFRAWWPEMPDDANLEGSCAASDRPTGWLLCQNTNYNYVTINEDEGFGGVGTQVSINPSSGLTMPPRGQWVEVRVHLDDPAAQGCGADATAVDPQTIAEQAITNCRGEMVLESVTPVAGP